MKKKFFLISLSLLLITGALAISRNDAGRMVDSEFPEFDSPRSEYGYAAEVGETSYWIFEIPNENTWVPVNKDTGKLSEDEAFENAFKIYYVIKNLKKQKKTSGYPAKSNSVLIRMEGEVETKISYINQAKQGMPEELSEETSTLLSRAEELENALTSLSNKKTELKESGNGLVESSSSLDDVERWERDFMEVIDAKSKVVEEAYDYNEYKSEDYSAAASEFKSKNETTTDEVDTVNQFISNVGISGVPGNLPKMNSTNNDWRQWFENTFSEEKINEKVSTVAENYRQKTSQISVGERRENATEMIENLVPKAGSLENSLGACKSDLSISEQKSLEEMEEKMNKSQNAFEEAEELYSQQEYEEAEKQYLNAKGYAEDAEESIDNLEGTECPETDEKEERPGPTEILMNFLLSIWGMIFLALIIALVVIWVIEHREGGEEYEEDYDYYDY